MPPSLVSLDTEANLGLTRPAAYEVFLFSSPAEAVCLAGLGTAGAAGSTILFYIPPPLLTLPSLPTTQGHSCCGNFSLSSFAQLAKAVNIKTGDDTVSPPVFEDQSIRSVRTARRVRQYIQNTVLRQCLHTE